jgi:hypothetical protein
VGSDFRFLLNNRRNKMLDIQMLKAMPPQTVFASGMALDTPEGLYMAGTGKLLLWVAVRGGIHDWAIYCHSVPTDIEETMNAGDKVTFKGNICRLVPCDDEAFAMYRY